MSALRGLAEYGQSYWLDDLSRTMLNSGELKRLVDDEGLSGVTSNPVIFRTAIESSSDYDSRIQDSGAAPANTIYETLIVGDVRDACDVLRPVYDRTEGYDGFVSLEVSPHAARLPADSMAEARRFWQAVGRPNLLIKLPGTPECVSAIEELLFEGINVNVTLLFSIEGYEKVALAYRNALERRVAAKRQISQIASVASFFLSRIDTLVDSRLQEAVSEGSIEARRLLGRTGVANAKLAYQRFKELTAASRWQTLARSGARVQRLLWASTGTKNPSYPELMYVEPLIGRDTISTMPRDTADAFALRGKANASLEQDIAGAKQLMKGLQKAGIDLAPVAEQLLDEGIQKFTNAFDALAKTIEKRRSRTS